MRGTTGKRVGGWAGLLDVSNATETHVPHAGSGGVAEMHSGLRVCAETAQRHPDRSDVCESAEIDHMAIT